MEIVFDETTSSKAHGKKRRGIPYSFAPSDGLPIQSLHCCQGLFIGKQDQAMVMKCAVRVIKDKPRKMIGLNGSSSSTQVCAISTLWTDDPLLSQCVLYRKTKKNMTTMQTSTHHQLAIKTGELEGDMTT